MNNEIINSDSMYSKSGVAFEMFVSRVLSDYLESKNKKILHEIINLKQEYDFYLPNGIDEIDKPAYIIIKFYNNYKKFLQYLDSEIVKLKEIDNFVIFITNFELFEDSIQEYKNNLINRKIGDIWDLGEFKRRTGKYYTKHINLIRNPDRYLINDIFKENFELSYANERNKHITYLKGEFSKDNITLFLGAGVSIDANIPDWFSFVNELYSMMFSKILDKKIFDDSFKEQLKKLANLYKDNNLIIQLRQIRSQFKTNEYFNIVKKALYKNNPKPDTEILKSIAYMCKPRRDGVGVKSIITYNFDDLVELALLNLKIENNSISCEKDETDISKLNIYHVHGYLPRLANSSIANQTELIFSEEDYHRVYSDAYCWSNLVQLNHLREDVCIFIGCSLNDPNLRRLLDITYQKRQMNKHYAILKKLFVSESEFEEIDQNALNEFKKIDLNLKTFFYEKIGLNIIWIDEYNEIPEILKRICDK